MYHIICVHSPVEECLGCFQLLAIIHKAAINIVKHESLLYIGASFGYIPSSGTAGSSRRTISDFLRNSQIDFQGDFTSLPSHQLWRSVPLSPHHCQHLLSPEVLILAILLDARWNLRIILIYISLMAKDAEHFS